MSLTEIEQLLYQKIGLDSSSIGPHAINKAIDTRMTTCNTSNIEDYCKLLKKDINELKELIDEVVIPETWFFRNNDPFKMLVKFAREEWLPKNSTTPLRILSAPCATGEEPYSISIALIDAGLTPSQFHIDAIDISQRNLEACKKAQYREYSFRDVDPRIRDRFFRKRDRHYQLDILVRATVNFRQASILDPNIVYTRMPYDVVFCRNLLIYFDQATQQETRKMLSRLLKDDGILFVGHAETGGFIKDWSPSRRYPKAFALRKTIETNLIRTVSKKKHGTSPVISKLTNTRRPRLNPENKPYSSPNHEQALDKTIINTLPTLSEAEALANNGDFIAAETICLQCLQADKQNAQAYYLLAMVQLGTGKPNTAVNYLKKVIYLQPHNIEALMFLATLTDDQGDPALARRYRERAQRTSKLHNKTVMH